MVVVIFAVAVVVVVVVCGGGGSGDNFTCFVDSILLLLVHHLPQAQSLPAQALATLKSLERRPWPPHQ